MRVSELALNQGIAASTILWHIMLSGVLVQHTLYSAVQQQADGRSPCVMIKCCARDSTQAAGVMRGL